MSGWSITLTPFFSWQVIAGLSLFAFLFALYGIVQKTRGAWLRFWAVCLLTFSLTNPTLLQENRKPLKTVIALVHDATDSQKINQRQRQSETALKAVKQRLSTFNHFELREITVTNNRPNDDEVNHSATALFQGLNQLLSDVPPDRIGGAILFTDGQVHDIPEKVESLGFNAPVHALISGYRGEKDRQINIQKAPRFGIVGESQEIIYRVNDHHQIAQDTKVRTPIDVEIFIDGELVAVENTIAGEEARFYFDVPHGGKTVIEMRVAALEDEITRVNNQAFTVMEGIRENLRVLLISGEPHGGERTWRNLLKSDAAVDLVHFTILRPPEKQDGTPVNELSLIAFPVRELFIEKIDEFDLIIFDRYKRRGVLPMLYFDNIARYVQDGGAILIAAGPEHAHDVSIERSPLASVLPVTATGTIIEKPYRPKVSEIGRRHPVTRRLPGLQERENQSPDQWSQWFRLIEGQATVGDMVMNNGEGSPLLVLSRQEEGRVAMLMSDHIWLWARGFKGGGPHSTLLRRLSHWLMQEPELDEERLRATTQGNTIRIERQSLRDDPGILRLHTPDNQTIDLNFSPQADGFFTAEYDAQTLGLYRAENQDLTALTHVGPANPQEYIEVTSTGALLHPFIQQTKGLIARLLPNDQKSGDGTIENLTIPRIVPIKGTGPLSGKGWMGLKLTNASQLEGMKQWPLFAGLLGLCLLLFTLAGLWAREGKT